MSATVATLFPVVVEAGRQVRGRPGRSDGSPRAQTQRSRHTGAQKPSLRAGRKRERKRQIAAGDQAGDGGRADERHQHHADKCRREGGGAGLIASVVPSACPGRLPSGKSG
jgi:hypothetical protein